MKSKGKKLIYLYLVQTIKVNIKKQLVVLRMRKPNKVKNWNYLKNDTLI